MNRPCILLRAAFFILMVATVVPATAQSTQGTFTGGDAGEGLDLQGDIILACHMGGDPVIYEVGDALFKPDSDLTLSGADEVINGWAAPEFGPAFYDANLAQVMQSIRHNGREHGTMTLTKDRSMAIGDTYKLQLLFIESGPALRRFDIVVGGSTVLAGFTLPAATDPPVARVVTYTFVAAERDFVVILDGAPVPDEAGVDTNPILSALTLERCAAFTAVVTNTNDNGPGSLRKAIADAAGCPASITFAPALNNQLINAASGQLEITGIGPTIIDASNLSAGLAIAPNLTSRVLRIGPGAQVRLTRLSLISFNPGAINIGGAVLNDGTIILDRCTLSQNQATMRGGALYNTGTATLSGCNILNNSAVDGGEAGGGIYNDATGHLTATGCNFGSNHAPVSGGGLENRGTAVLTGCTFYSNDTYLTGGGMANHGSAALTICTLANNVAGSRGGGLSNDGIATLTGCTLTGNSLTEPRGSPQGGGMAHYAAAANSSLTLDHSLIAGNTIPSTGTGSDVFTASPIFASWCLIGDGSNSGVLHATNGNKAGGGGQPLIPAGLGPPAFNGGLTLTALPLPGSAAIDAGNPGVIPPAGTTDQRGAKRRRGSSQDIGAVESMPDLSTVRLTLFPPSGGSQNLHVAIPVDVGPLSAQTSIDLTNWTPVFLTPAGPSGLFSVPFNPAEKKRFYRAAEVP